MPLLKGLQRQGRFDVLPLTILVSDRRWQRDGWLMRTLSNRLLALGFAIGVPPARLARWFPRGRSEKSEVSDRASA